MGTKTAKNKPTQTSKNAKIQSRMVRQNIHTSTPVLSIHKNMPHLRISKKQPNTRHPQMDMPILQHTPPKRHKHSNKHSKRSKKIKFMKKNNNKYELVSQRGIAW